MTEHADAAVELPIRNDSDPMMRKLLNLLPKRTTQIEVVTEIIIEEQGKDKVVFQILKELFKEDSQAFREYLRETLYWQLRDWTTAAGGIHYQRSIAGALTYRVLILTEVLKGWRWLRLDQKEPTLSPDAEECFRFACEAYADFNHPPNLLGNPFPERAQSFSIVRRKEIDGSDLRKEIKNLLRQHMDGRLPGDYGSRPFFAEDDLGKWMQKNYLPGGILHVLLHGHLNIIGDKESLQRLTA